MDIYNPVYPGLYYFDTFTFTTLGTSGHRGPDSTKTYANAPWREGDFSIVGGQQQWTVPATGTYRIEAAGAYGATPGRVVSGEVDLNEGQVVSLLVGQQPYPLTANVVDNVTVGGGGGTFVASDGVLLMVASGGDGTGGSAASFSPYGTGNGINGAGYLSNGTITNATFQFLKPVAYVDGGYGNMYWYGSKGDGGFGGGQSPVTVGGVSGGGGYTGSPGDGVSGATCYGAGTITDLGATSNSAGYVTISLIDPAPLQPTWSWDDETPWENINAFQSNTYVVSWCETLGLFVAAGAGNVAPAVSNSPDGLKWTNTQSTLNGYDFYVALVAATDKPIIVSGQLVSNDGGITWNNSNYPLNLQFVEYPVQYIWYTNGQFIGSYGSQLASSGDGYSWTVLDTNLTGYTFVKTYNNSVYVGIRVPEFYGFIEVPIGELVYSTDLINWTYTAISDISDVTFGNGLFVAIGSSSVYTSTDGGNWVSATPIPFTSSYQKIIFGNGLFLSFQYDTFTTTTDVFRSTDGSNWTKTLSTIETGLEFSVTYSPSLGFFMIVPVINKNPLVTLDGDFFVPRTNFFKANPTDVAWSEERQTYVTTTESGYIYTSVDDGNTWIENKITNETIALTRPQYSGGYTAYLLYPTCVTWSSELGQFFLYLKTVYNVGNSYYKINIFTSTDGLNWTSQGIYIPPFDTYNQASGERSFSKPFWCKERGYFITGGLISRDGIEWVYNDISFTKDIAVLAYSPTLNRFVGVNQKFNPSSEYPYPRMVYSDDGINYNYANDIPEVYASYARGAVVAWSPELQIFIKTNVTQGAADARIYLSTDGINWNVIYTVPSINHEFHGVSWSSKFKKFFSFMHYTWWYATPPDFPYFFPKAMYYFESSDGYNWTIQHADLFTGMYTRNLFLCGDRFIYIDSIANGMTFSPKFIKQI